ncbi:MAG: GNAT family N-acetyltransferase [Verrucomicrobia bacterium]|nr:GNAT family N-acetyltransferase [Verrucomicrobiota bacterium]
MKDLNTLGVLYGALFYFVFLKHPLGRWLQKGFLRQRQGRVARAQIMMFNLMSTLRLVPPIILSNIDLKKLTEKPLPKEYEVRLWKPEDTQACMEIYQMNAPGRFPAEVEQEFEEVLKRDDGALLVIEDHGRIVACGGITLEGIQRTLIYGLIHSEFQKKGIGRLLLLSRLARIQGPEVIVNICAVDDSIGYYERFGFTRYALWFSQNGEAHPMAGVSVHPEDCEEIATFLASEGYPVLPALSA